MLDRHYFLSTTGMAELVASLAKSLPNLYATFILALHLSATLTPKSANRILRVRQNQQSIVRL